MNDLKVVERNGFLGVVYKHKSGIQIGQDVFCRGVYDNCRKCGKRFFSLLSQQKRLNKGIYCSYSCSKSGIKLTKLHIKNISLSKKGEKNPMWNGGKPFVNTQGYVMIKDVKNLMANCDGRVLEHRLVMSEFLGRSLTKDEVVHHKNHNRSDNRLENLELLSRSNHSKHHIRATNKNWVYLKTKDIKCPRCNCNINLESIIKVST